VLAGEEGAYDVLIGEGSEHVVVAGDVDGAVAR
jgi:hypothetical protein